MLPLLLAAIVFFFLVIGAVVFVACMAIPFLRKYALSAALWCALWGPACSVLLLVAFAGIIGGAFITRADAIEPSRWVRFAAALGRAYIIAGCLTTTAAVTAITWIHQFLIQRLTFAFFRVYATAVSAGIGGVFGWVLGFTLQAHGLRYPFLLSLAGMLFLTTSFGVLGYRAARSLRGTAPGTLTWITADEFNGV